MKGVQVAKMEARGPNVLQVVEHQLKCVVLEAGVAQIARFQISLSEVDVVVSRNTVELGNVMREHTSAESTTKLCEVIRGMYKD